MNLQSLIDERLNERLSVRVPMLNMSYYDILLFIFILTMGLLVRFWAIGHAAPWADELHSILYSRNSIGHLIDVTRTTDIHPPFYFLTVKTWASFFGESREAARSLSVLLGGVAIGLVFVIGRKMFNTQMAFVAMAFFATFPTAVHFSREIRMYPLLTVLFLGSFFFFLKLNEAVGSGLAFRRKLSPVLGMAGLLALGFYTHYTAALLFMLYSAVSLWLLLLGKKTHFTWIVGTLAVATLLTIPQLLHLFSSSLGDPDKAWMQPTTLASFYGVTLGAFPYHMLLKLPIFAIMASGLWVLWRRNNELTGILVLFTAGGILLTAFIGIFEPMFLVRSIQVFTVFTAFFIAGMFTSLNPKIAYPVILGVIFVNLITVRANEYLPAREALPVEKIEPLTSLLDPKSDKVFAKAYLRPQFEYKHADLFGYAYELEHDHLEEDLDVLDAVSSCHIGVGERGCRAFVFIIEKDSLFRKNDIAAWNAKLSELAKRYPETSSEFVRAGYRILILSSDQKFAKNAQEAL